MQSGPVEVPGVTPRFQAHQSASTPRSTQQPGPRHYKQLSKDTVRLSYTSAQPDFSDTPSNHGSQGKGFRADARYAPRYQGVTRVRGFSISSIYGGSDIHIFSSGRKPRSLHNQQMLPQISVTPATKHLRSRKRVTTTDAVQPGTPKPITVKRVEVSLHQVHPKTKASKTSGSLAEDIENISLPPKVEVNCNPTVSGKEVGEKDVVLKGVANLPLKSIDLNKGLNLAAAAMRRRNRNNKVQSTSLEKSLAMKVEAHVVPLSYLPLKEVYLKSDTTQNKKQILQQQHHKTIRIIQWLKDLNYLDESAVERARSEVENLKFQLPEIKEPTL